MNWANGWAKALQLNRVLALTAVLMVSTAASAGVLPDEEKAMLTMDDMDFISVSPDGRVLAGVLQGTANVRFFDAWFSRSGDVDGYSVDSINCSTVQGLFVSREISAKYLVSLVCGDGDSSTEDGQIFQFWISEATDVDSKLLLEAGSVTAHAGTSGFKITAATRDTEGETLYIAADSVATTIPQSIVYSVDITGESGSVSSYSAPSSVVQMVEMTYNEDAQNILVSDSSGALYVVYQDFNSAFLGVECAGSRPVAMLALSIDWAVVFGNSTDVYVVQLGSSSVDSCTAYDWGFNSGPAAVARVKSDGQGNSSGVDYLYIRGQRSTGGNISVVAVGSITSNPPSPTFETTNVVSAQDVTGNDLLVAGTASGAISRLYLGTSSGVSVISSGPWLSVSLDSEPVVVTDQSSVISLSITSDEAADTVWFDSNPPYDSATVSNLELSALSADSDVTIELDTAQLEAIAAGRNLIFVYAKDVDSNIGWVGLPVRYVSTPSAPGSFEVTFGDSKLYLNFTYSADSTAEDYEILISPASFQVPESSDDPLSDWDELTFSIDGVIYPWDGAWPMSLDYSAENSLWTTEGQTNTYLLTPLTNGFTYYVALRAVSGGVAGDWSTLGLGMPQKTCGATCLADDAGGFCSILSQGRMRPPGRSLLPLWWVLAPGILLIWERRGR